MEKRITARENFEAIANYIKENGGNADWVTFIEAQIEKLDKRAVKAKAKRAEKAAEPDEILDAIKAALTYEPQTVEEILAKIEVADVTKNKVTARIGKIAGVVKGEAKIEIDGKKVKRVTYAYEA